MTETTFYVVLQRKLLNLIIDWHLKLMLMTMNKTYILLLDLKNGDPITQMRVLIGYVGAIR